MKLLIVASDYPPYTGGIAKVLDELSQVYRRHETMVMAPQHPEQKPDDKVVRLSLDHRANCFTKFIQHMKWLIKLTELCKLEKPDFILLGCLSPLGYLVWLFHLFINIPYVSFAHGSELPVKSVNLVRRVLARWIFERSHAVLCISDYSLKLVKELAPRAKTVRVFLGVDSKVFKPMGKSAPFMEKFQLHGKKILMTLGRFSPRKGLDVAIRALAEIKRERSDIKLVLVGDGPERSKLENLVNDLSLKKDVIFTGKVADQELPSILNTADIFLFLSRDIKGDFEGFGLVALEASACGIPVIASRSGAIPEVVLDKQTGLLVEQDNVSDLIEKIRLLLGNVNLAQALSREGREQAIKKNWSEFATGIRNTLGN